MLLLPACTDPEPEPPAPVEVLVSDLRGNNWFFAEGGEAGDRYWLSDLEPEVCQGEDHDVYCLLFQSRLHRSWDGVDEVLFTYSALDVGDGDDDGKNDLIARVQSVDRESFATRWRLTALDFSAVGADYCDHDPADPCVVKPELSTGDTWDCNLHMTHDMMVTAEDAESVAMWLVDSRNSRMLHVRLRRDSTCGEVDVVLDRHHPDWDIYNSVNSLQWSEDGAEDLLMSVKGSFSDAESGESQEGGPGRGKIIRWTGEGGIWAQRWEFPPEEAGAFLNDPHGVVEATGPEGTPWILYAHSLGDAEKDFSYGTGGTIGVLRREEGAPTYLYDATIEGLHFPRDVTPLGDGSFLVTDSGCIGDDCAYESQVWRVRLPEAEPTGKSGIWTADHAEQERVEAEVIGGPWFTGENLLYSTEWIE